MLYNPENSHRNEKKNVITATQVQNNKESMERISTDKYEKYNKVVQTRLVRLRPFK